MKLRLSILLALMSVVLLGQNNLQINGLNETQFVYRTVSDSLHTYFRNSFGFNIGYQDFRFGMKFNADLPRYNNQESELLDELDANRLSVAWEELYAEYAKNAFSIHVGTTSETFGQGISFRSYEDLEFDEDHRLESFLLKYDDKLQFKAIYGALESEDYAGRYDLAYGSDIQYPVWQGLRLGASAMGYRNLEAFGHYSFRDVFATRAIFTQGNLDSYAEFALSKKYHVQGASDINGSAIYLNADYLWGDLSIGGAYKRYDDFSFRLQDLPLANYHGETLSDVLASGLDEEGWQIRSGYKLMDDIYLNADYAEAWDDSRDRKMNDLHLAMDVYQDTNLYQLSWSHIEKVDDLAHTWQKEFYPTLVAHFTVNGRPLQLTGEFKTVEKQQGQNTNSHYEPMLQADFSIKKLALSLTVSSWWENSSNVEYMPNIEAKYPLFEHTNLTLFAGKESGGKVCRNGICRYVAPFEGLRVELNTRF